MALLTLEEIAKSYDDRPLLRGVDLVVRDGDRIGLVGANGSGKSTLLRILAGGEEPDSGRRTERRDLTIGYLEQEPVLPADDTARAVVQRGQHGRAEVLRRLEDVHRRLAAPDLDGRELERLLAEQGRLEDRLERHGGHDVEHAVEGLLDRLGLRDPDVPCGDLSGGERRRVALARLLLAEPDVLLLDEPTNHLDAELIDWLEDRLLQSRATLVLVTHDRYFLDRVVTGIVELEHGRLHASEGGYFEFLAARAARLEREQSAEQSRRNLLRREAEWMRRGPPARTTKAKARIQRYEALAAATPDDGDRELVFTIPPGPRLGDRVLRLRDVGFGIGARRLVDGLDLEVGPGTRLGIIGPNGAGKTTLLRVVQGEVPPDRGEVVVGPTVRFAAIGQERRGLDPEKTVLEEVGGGNDHVFVGGRALRIESFLERFLFPGARKHTEVAKLSGGERNRVLLAKLLTAGGNVLVLDEPTNDLDLMSLRVLEEALCAFPGVVLVVSHDRFFLDRVTTRVLMLDGHGGHRRHEGDVSSLLGRLAAERAAATRGGPRRPPAAAPATPERPRRLSWHERQELDALPDRIQGAETALAEVDRELADPALYAGEGEKVRELTARRLAMQDELDRLYRRWEELESIVAAS